MNYKLIALDMDGTVLNDKKEITAETAKAIHEALEQGVEVVFCTGRSYAEMRGLLKGFPDMHYLCGESGALVFDLQEKKVLRQTTFPISIVELIRDETKGKNLMPAVFSNGECCVNRTEVHRMADFHMDQYQDLYEAEATRYDHVLETMAEEKNPVEKINCYCANTVIRDNLYHRLQELEIEATLVYAEETSLELSPLGLSKATGLQALCEITGFHMEEVVMVGDANNDIAALEAAGLAIAMGNANEQVKRISQICVSDNNHDGCAEAIRYVMNERR